MNETMVTLTGWVGGTVSLRRAGDAPVAGFRVATTPRHFQRATNAWVDGDTQWYSVSAWRGLADHCARSLRRGDPVVVHGRLTHRTYADAEGVTRTSVEVEALVVGHDLTWGTSRFSRTTKASAGEVGAGVGGTADGAVGGTVGGTVGGAVGGGGSVVEVADAGDEPVAAEPAA